MLENKKIILFISFLNKLNKNKIILIIKDGDDSQKRIIELIKKELSITNKIVILNIIIAQINNLGFYQSKNDCLFCDKKAIHQADIGIHSLRFCGNDDCLKKTHQYIF